MEVGKAGKGKRRKPYVPAAERFALKAMAAREGGAAPAAAAQSSRGGTQTVSARVTATGQQRVPLPSDAGGQVSAAAHAAEGARDNTVEQPRVPSAASGGQGRPRGAKVRTSGTHAAVAHASVEAVVSSVIQPNRKSYGGMGLARPSVMLPLGSHEFAERFAELFDEHVDGFSGKAFAKARNRESSQVGCRLTNARVQHTCTRSIDYFVCTLSGLHLSMLLLHRINLSAHVSPCHPTVVS
jgi:hypothetical protein